MMQDYIRIGYVLKPQGIRGEVKILPLTDDVGRYQDLKTVYLEGDGRYQEVQITVNRIEKDAVYLYLSGTYSRDAAEQLRGKYLCVRREDAVALPEGSWFVCDLEGLQVLDENDTPLGVLREVIQTGAVDAYAVQREDGTRFIFPALKRVILQVDLQTGRMILNRAALSEVAVDEN